MFWAYLTWGAQYRTRIMKSKNVFFLVTRPTFVGASPETKMYEENDLQTHLRSSIGHNFSSLYYNQVKSLPWDDFSFFQISFLPFFGFPLIFSIFPCHLLALIRGRILPRVHLICDSSWWNIARLHKKKWMTQKPLQNNIYTCTLCRPGGFGELWCPTTMNQEGVFVSLERGCSRLASFFFSPRRLWYVCVIAVVTPYVRTVDTSHPHSRFVDDNMITNDDFSTFYWFCWGFCW